MKFHIYKQKWCAACGNVTQVLPHKIRHDWSITLLTAVFSNMITALILSTLLLKLR